MNPGYGITLLIWGVVILIISGGFLYFAIRYYKKGKLYHDQQKALLVEAERRVKLQYNKIAAMTPSQLTNYIGGIFSRYLELNGELGSDKDNLAVERLFTSTLSDTLVYIGEDTLEAIEYYYGDQYVEKWAKLAHQLLEKRRKLGGVVRGETSYEELEQLLTREFTKNAET